MISLDLVDEVAMDSSNSLIELYMEFELINIEKLQ